MKPLVLYRADCTDGFGAAYAAGFETDLPTIMSWVGLGGTLNG